MYCVLRAYMCQRLIFLGAKDLAVNKTNITGHLKLQKQRKEDIKIYVPTNGH